MRKIKTALPVIFLLFLLPVSAHATKLYQGTLKNGLTYRIYRSSTLPIISVDIKIKAGSYFDKKFGEANVVAKSIESCDTARLSAEDFRDMVDALGGVISSSASKQYIDIKAKFPLSKADRMFCLLSEMFKSRLDKKNFDFVKKHQIDRIKALKNDKDYLAVHAAFVNLIKQKSYSHTSLGTINGIKSLTRKDAKTFLHRHFNTSNMVISVAGGKFNPADIAAMIKEHFSFLKPGKSYTYEPVIFNPGLHVTDILKNVEQSYIYFAFPAFKLSDKRHYAAQIIAFILGGGLDSVLMKDIRTKHGYAYSVFAVNYQLKQGGIFIIGMQTQNKFTLEAINRVFDDIDKIQNFLTPEKLRDAKRYLTGSNEIGLQNSLSVADALADGYLNNVKGLPWEHYKRMINAVTLKELKETAKAIFNKKTLSIGIVSLEDHKNVVINLAKEYGY